MSGPDTTFLTASFPVFPEPVVPDIFPTASIPFDRGFF